MKKPKLSDIRNEADAIYATYSANFAGKPRATRDLALLDELLTRLEKLIEDARTLLNGSRNPAVLSILDTATENLERYREERGAIAQQQKNPLAVPGARLADRANRVFDRYQRHFAGLDRGTRDHRLLRELADELREIRGEMQTLVQKGASATARDLETVQTQLALYETEAENIASAQRAGTAEERANRLAQLANAQFKLYNHHFAGKSRPSRRPGLLERMIANLEDYRSQMRELRSSGFRSDMNAKNIQIVEQNLELYRTELVEIRKAREQASVDELAGSLGGAANDAMGIYRDSFAGKDRKSRDLELMGALCDQMAEIAMQMRDISQNIELEMNEKNLRIVEENHAMYEQEYRRIKEAQGIA